MLNDYNLYHIKYSDNVLVEFALKSKESINQIDFSDDSTIIFSFSVDYKNGLFAIHHTMRTILIVMIDYDHVNKIFLYFVI